MRIMKAGATSQSIYVEILDSASTTGGRKTGIAYNSAGLTAYYVLAGGSATAITLATLAAANSAWSSGGFKEVDATNMPGIYRLDVPDAAIASGPSVVITLKGAAGMVQVSVEIQLTAIDFQDTVRAGMTALPNAAAEAAGGLFTRGTGAGQINQAANGQVDVNAKTLNGTALTARDIGASVLLSSGTGAGQLDFTSGRVKADTVYWNAAAVAVPSTAGVPNVNLAAWLNVAPLALTSQRVQSQVGAIANNAITAASIANAAIDNATFAADVGSTALATNMIAKAAEKAIGVAGLSLSAIPTIATVTTVTNLTNAPTNGDFTAAMKTSLDAATPAVTVSDKTGFSLSSAGIQAIWDALTSALTTVGSIGKKLADWVIGTTQTGDTYALANGANGFVAIKADTAAILVDTGTTLDAALVVVDGNVDAIKAKTDQFVFTVANQVDANALSGGGGLDAAGVRSAVGLASANLDTQLSGIQSDTDNIQTRIPAALVSGRMDASVGAMAADTLTASALAADAVTEIQSGLATSAALATVDGNVDSILADTNELQTDWANGGRLDLILDARASQTSVDDLPTNAELASALAAADDAILAAIAALTIPTAAANADAVWDEVLSGHLTAGSTGAALNAAGAAGDPWSTTIPGAYGAGTAGKIVGDNLNATVSSRSTQTSVDDLPTNAELATALASADDAILAAIALLNNLSQADVRTAVGLGSANLDTQLADLPTNAELAAALASADDAILAAIAALNNLSSAQVTAAVPTAIQNADALLKRDWTAITGEASRSTLNALRMIRNRFSTLTSPGDVTIYKEDDLTVAFTKPVLTDNTADPIVEG